MIQKIIAMVLTLLSLLYSAFGYSFAHKAENIRPLYASEHVSPGGNAKTDELKTLFGAVKARTPAVTLCPEKDPYPEDDRITAIYYEGEACEGRTPRVFAYIGFPENASAAAKVPAIVLVHGGGCHAWAPWVQYWVAQGYAAISIDGFGQQYIGSTPYEDGAEYWTTDPLSHLPMDNLTTRDKAFTEQWFYYYISDIILANNILRTDERVDNARIGLTGISWGGFAASIAVCYDDRFAFAAPVYGSGFQDVSQTVYGEAFRGPGVSDVWDAKLLLPEVQMPIMWFNSNCDPFFSADSNAASAAAAPNGAVTFVPSFPHGMNAIELPELLRFANEQTGMGAGNIKIEQVSFDEENAVVSFTLPAGVTCAAVYIYYRSSPLEYDGAYLKDPWQRAKGVTLGNNGTVRIPEEATQFYVMVSGKTLEGLSLQTLHATTGIYTVDQ